MAKAFPFSALPTADHVIDALSMRFTKAERRKTPQTMFCKSMTVLCEFTAPKLPIL
jgi:hypothetical protein